MQMGVNLYFSHHSQEHRKKLKAKQDAEKLAARAMGGVPDPEHEMPSDEKIATLLKQIAPPEPELSNMPYVSPHWPPLNNKPTNGDPMAEDQGTQATVQKAKKKAA
jgi:hypothetical protein